MNRQSFYGKIDIKMKFLVYKAIRVVSYLPMSQASVHNISNVNTLIHSDNTTTVAVINNQCDIEEKFAMIYMSFLQEWQSEMQGHSH